MGFFSRLFSRKGKKKHNGPLKQQYGTQQVLNDEEHEAVVGKLLRSTSARVLSEPDYAVFPPIPHPINNVIQTPASSTLSLESSSLSQRGTYNVTVHRRRRHASTEFPHANRGLNKNEHGELQSVDDSRLLRLRSDPSVASLLELYDDHGRVASDAFANDESLAIPEGRAQVQRNGSTLRQLLGVSSSNGDNSEGDISWAERYLAESDATSVTSSSGVRTPETPAFNGGQLPDVSIASDPDASYDNPALSSMEVEVNNSFDSCEQALEPSSKTNSPYRATDSATPQRASQIFDFLTRQKQSNTHADCDRTLPEIPSCFSSPSEEGNNDNWQSSANRENSTKRLSEPPIPLSSDAQRLSRIRSSLLETTPRQDIYQQRPKFSDDNQRGTIVTPFKAPSAHGEHFERNDIQVLMTGPTKVILTAPTPGTNHVGSRVPLGPRRPNRKSSSGSIQKRRSVLGEVSNSSSILGDPFLIISPKRKSSLNRRNSTSSSTHSSSQQEHERNGTYISHPKKIRPSSPQDIGRLKENQLTLSVKNELPSTPLRSVASMGSRLHLRNSGKVRNPAVRDPNLSSELSPVGKQMMNDVRQQRIRPDRTRLGNRF